MQKLIIAHRGASAEKPENTLAAFKRAMELGADMIELDVRRTRDGVLVVIHDPKIQNQKIRDLSRSELKKINPHIPTFEKVLKLAAGKIKLDIEIKIRGAENQVLELALKYLKPEEFIISSFLGSVIKKIKELRPGITTGLIFGVVKPGEHLKLLKLMALRLAAKADILILNKKVWKAELARYFPHHKQLIYIWTVDDETQISKLLKHKQISGVITNDPGMGVKLKTISSNSK